MPGVVVPAKGQRLTDMTAERTCNSRTSAHVDTMRQLPGRACAAGWPGTGRTPRCLDGAHVRRHQGNDLISNHVVPVWLMGQDPPTLDILAWNSDSTRVPAAMHSFYLRNFYVKNRLATGEPELAGEMIRLGHVKQDAYIVGAENDHIVPWRSAYAATRLLVGRCGSCSAVANTSPASSTPEAAGYQCPPRAQFTYLPDHAASLVAAG